MSYENTSNTSTKTLSLNILDENITLKLVGILSIMNVSISGHRHGLPWISLHNTKDLILITSENTPMENRKYVIRELYDIIKKEKHNMINHLRGRRKFIKQLTEGLDEKL